jgi:hypothetical protein
MKEKIITSLVALAIPVAFAASARAQGTFQNLDFESAHIPNGTQPGPIATTNALPGWSVYYGASQVTQISYDDISLGASQVTLVSTNDPFGPNAIQGNFSVLLQGGPAGTDVSIRQSSLVPVTAESITFEANVAGPMSVSLGGQNISISAIGAGTNYTIFGGNIPLSMAGQIEQLVFSDPGAVGGNNAWTIDSIVFSPNMVPEPSMLGLLTASGLLLALHCRRKK